MKGMKKQEVKRIRKALGLTGQRLADLLGVTANTVFRWEMGIREAKGPALKMLRELAKEAKETA